MKRIYWFLFFLFGTLISVSSFLLKNYESEFGNNAVLENRAEKLERSVQRAYLIIEKYKNNNLPISQREERLLNEEGIEFFNFKKGDPTHWSTNELFVDPALYPPGYFILPKPNVGYFLVGNFKSDTVDRVFAYSLLTKSNKSNLFSEENTDDHIRNLFSIQKEPQDNSIAIDFPNLPLFYLKMEQYYPQLYSDLLLFVGIALIILSIYKIAQSYFKQTFIATLIAFGLCYLELILFYYDYLFANVKRYNLFSAEIYASSSYFPNLGTMFWQLILAAALLTWIKNQTKQLEKARQSAVRYVILPLSTLLLIVSLFFVISETGKIVIDSSINFDLHQIHLVNRFTLLGVIIIATMHFCVYRLWQILDIVLQFSINKKQKKWLSLAIILISTICFTFLEPYQCLAILTVVCGLLAGDWIRERFRDAFRVVARLITPALATSIIFNHNVEKKEKDTREIIATKILLKNEKEPVGLLNKVENLLKKDNSVADYYTCTDETKSQFENKLKQFYLGEFTDYEIQIFDFDSTGKFYRERNAFDYNTLNNALYYSNVCKPVTANFVFVNEMKLRGSYLGRFPVYQNNHFLGVYFILLKPQTGELTGRFSDLFQHGPFESLFAENDYSYAIYSNKKLNRRYGKYNYSNNLDSTVYINNADYNNYNHSVYSDNLRNVIIFSKPIKSFLQSLTGFTFLLIIAVFLSLIALLIMWLRRQFLWLGPLNIGKLRQLLSSKQNWPINKSKGLFLSNRIQLYVILVVFSTFVVILIMTMNYFNANYSNRQRETLWERTTDIAKVVGTQTNLDEIFQKFRTGLVYDLSNYYKNDISIYRADGRLLMSSNDKLFTQEYIGNIINPKAYRKLHDDGLSGFIEEEELGNLTYISSYYTLLDNNLEIKGYLNVPYFSNRKDLYREISNYAVTLINLFVLVFALAAMVAFILARRITEPLNLVRKQMGIVKFGSSNAPLLWAKKDEIGLLIDEYNKMLLKLEESTNRLAESERQGAWREMAKQVAHEIKNPLTPMKLSLQHLQYAMDRKDANIEEKIKKTSTLLIDQIDSLSKMAEEFSSFAKMPEAKLEVTSLRIILERCIQLMERDHHCKVKYVLPPAEILSQVDAHQLGRVFTNIIKNAQQAMEEKVDSELNINFTVNIATITLSFKDNGKGIPNELSEKIFSPNFSTKNSGMGLGLAISKKIIEGFEGKIWFTSMLNSGTTFFVELPIFKD